MATQQMFQIVAGPSKFDLMLALFDAPMDRLRPVQFTARVGAGGRVEMIHHFVHLSEVSKEDGSGESWNFRGWISRNGPSLYVKGYYRTDRRTGTMQFVE